MRVCDFCKKEMKVKYNPATLVSEDFYREAHIVTGPRYHIEITDPLNDNNELDICESCHKKISQMIEKLLFEEACKEENDG